MNMAKEGGREGYGRGSRETRTQRELSKTEAGGQRDSGARAELRGATPLFVTQHKASEHDDAGSSAFVETSF